MTKLKILAAAAASTLALGGATVATTAQAQPYYHGYSDSRLNTAYVNHLGWKIDRARERGMISWRQARDLHMQLASVQPLAWRAQTGQARPWEVRRLENVVNRIDSLTQGYAYNMRRPYYR